MLEYIKVSEKLKKKYLEKGWWSEKSIIDYWEETVERYGDKEYLVDDRGNRFSYKEVDWLSNSVAAYLEDIGIKEGDIVSFQCPVWAEFVLISLAVFKVSAIANPVAMFYGKEELARLLEKTKSKAYLGVSFFHKTDYEKIIKELKEEGLFQGEILLLDNLKMVKDKTLTLRQVLDREGKYGKAAESWRRKSKANGLDVCLILSTSGTSGGNKGVLLSHSNLLFSELSWNKTLGLTEKDTLFMASPLNHASGFNHGILATMLAGGKLVLQEKFKGKEAVEMIEREKVSYSMGATPFIYDILQVLKEKKISLPYFQYYFCGGAPVPPYLVEEGEKQGIKICEVYGSTESCPHTLVRKEEWEKFSGKSSGRALDGIEVKVVDENRRTVPVGTVGEEASRGPNLFLGYLNDKEATEKAIDDEGWFYSGDLCTSDAEGNIRIIGRKKDMILRGGENLDSNTIDAFLEGCPGVLDHTVVGMPDERLGERICAYLVVQEGISGFDLDRLKAYLLEKNMPKRFLPERLELISAIPRTHSGKVKKYLLVEDITKKLEAEHRKEKNENGG